MAPSSPDSPGKICIDIRNNGPSQFSGNFHLVCVGTSILRGQPTVQLPVATEESIRNTIGVGTGTVNTGLTVDPVLYFCPVIQHVIEVPDNRGRNPGNDPGAIGIPQAIRLTPRGCQIH